MTGRDTRSSQPDRGVFGQRPAGAPDGAPPPLSDKTVAERQCSRDMDWPNGVACGREPFLHCCWSVDHEGCDAGFVCVDHARELTAKRWTAVQAHEVGPDCGMPGARWFFDENVCRCDDGQEAGVAEHARQLAGASPGHRHAG